MGCFNERILAARTMHFRHNVAFKMRERQIKSLTTEKREEK